MLVHMKIVEEACDDSDTCGYPASRAAEGGAMHPVLAAAVRAVENYGWQDSGGSSPYTLGALCLPIPFVFRSISLSVRLCMKAAGSGQRCTGRHLKATRHCAHACCCMMRTLVRPGLGSFSAADWWPRAGRTAILLAPAGGSSGTQCFGLRSKCWAPQHLRDALAVAAAT